MIVNYAFNNVCYVVSGLLCEEWFSEICFDEGWFDWCSNNNVSTQVNNNRINVIKSNIQSGLTLPTLISFRWTYSALDISDSRRSLHSTPLRIQFQHCMALRLSLSIEEPSTFDTNAKYILVRINEKTAP